MSFPKGVVCMALTLVLVVLSDESNAQGSPCVEEPYMRVFNSGYRLSFTQPVLIWERRLTSSVEVVQWGGDVETMKGPPHLDLIAKVQVSPVIDGGKPKLYLDLVGQGFQMNVPDGVFIGLEGGEILAMGIEKQEPVRELRGGEVRESRYHIPLSLEDWKGLEKESILSIRTRLVGGSEVSYQVEPERAQSFLDAMACINSLNVPIEAPLDLPEPEPAVAEGGSVVVDRTMSKPSSDPVTPSLVFQPALLQPMIPRSGVRTGERCPLPITTGNRGMVMEAYAKRVDSLCVELEERNDDINGLYDRNKFLTDLANTQAEALARLRTDSARMASRSLVDEQEVQLAFLQRCLVTKSPARPGQRSYTVLHAFSEPMELDTFRVITVVTEDDRMEHYLEIVSHDGRLLFKEELFTRPLSERGSAGCGAEHEDLLVRSALGPEAFGTPAITGRLLSMYVEPQLYNAYFDLSEDSWERILNDDLSVAFVFRSDPERTRRLAYDRVKEEVVDLEPYR